MKVSVITVCKNEEKNIGKTMQSVLGQTYQDIEYIIMDGRSTDGTIKRIKNYELRITNKKYKNNINLIWKSGKDKGIYDAMNKGIRIARGEFIYFLNAGDILADRFVIKRVVEEYMKEPSDIIVGDTRVVYPKTGKTFVKKHAYVSKTYLFFDTVNHQAIFAKQSIFKTYGMFDTKYKIMADYDWELRMVEKHVSIRHISLLIALYREDGISALDNEKTVKLHKKERNRIIRKHFSSLERLAYTSLLPLDFICRKLHLFPYQ